MTRFSVILATLLALAGQAPAQDGTLAELFATPRTLPTPKPWPMRNLVTPGTLTVGITAKTPPGSFTAPSGEFDGSRVQLYRKLAEDMGLKVAFVRLDWPGILPGLAAGKFDLACEGGAWSNERLSSPDFLMARPISANATVAIVRRDSAVKGWSDLEGKRLGGVKGELYPQAAQRAGKPGSTLDLPGRPEGVLALLNRQVDAFAVDLVAARSLIGASPRGAELAIIGPPLDLLVQGFCVNAKQPDLLQAVNVLLTNYRVDGTLSALETKYYGTDEHVRLLSVVGY